MLNLVRIAVRNVTRNRRRTAITVAAIFIGIGVTVGIHGFVNGLQSSIVNNAIDSQLGALQIHRKGYVETVQATPLALDLADDPRLVSQVLANENVSAVTRRIAFGAMLAREDQDSVFVMVWGVDPKQEYVVCPKEVENVVAGKPLDPADPEGVLISEQLAKSANVKLGETVTLFTQDKDGVANAVDTHVRGLLVSKVPGDLRFVYVPLALAQTLLRMEGRVTELAVRVKDPKKVDETIDALRGALAPSLEVHGWRTLAKIIADAMALQNFAIRIVGIVFLIVVLVGIVNTMLMTVLERIREVGTMMSLGVRRRSILLLFLIESMTMGFFGGVLGVGAGTLAVAWMHHRGFDLAPPGMKITNIVRPEVGVHELLFFLAVAVAGSCVSAVYPAFKASRLKPVDALAHV